MMLGVGWVFGWLMRSGGLAGGDGGGVGGTPKVLRDANRSCHEHAIITMVTEAGKLASGRGPGVHPASQEKCISPLSCGSLSNKMN